MKKTMNGRVARSRSIASQLLIFLLLATQFAPRALAGFEFGIGSTSATGGRLTPALAGAYTQDVWGVFGSSTGVSNRYYYQSNYQLSYYWLLNSGNMWGGRIAPGFGLGGMYTIRSFRDLGASSESKSDDFLLGPALQLRWIFYESVYLGIDAIWGLRSLANIFGLSYQDYTCVSFGVIL